MRARRRSLGLAVALLFGSAGFVLASASPAAAQFEHISAYRVAIVIAHDGTLDIDERITYDFGSTPHHGIFRTIPVLYAFDSKQNRTYRITVEHVSVSGGASAKVDLSKEGADDVIK